MMTKNALGILHNRYAAVLKKCSLLNVLGSLAVAGMVLCSAPAFAQTYSPATQTPNPSGSTVSIMDAATLGNPMVNDGTISGGGTRETLYGDFIDVGMYGNGGGSIDFHFTNNGTITIDKNLSWPASMGAVGMYSLSAPAFHTLINAGNMAITNQGTSGAYGQMVEFRMGTEPRSVTLQNLANARMEVTSIGGDAYGMSVGVENIESDTIMQNYGFMQINAHGMAYGMQARGGGNRIAQNSGSMSVASSNGTAFGMELNTDAGNITAENTSTGTIQATALGTGNAQGVVLSAIGSATSLATTIFGNSGTIIATATAGSATGLAVSGTNNNATLTNNGTITATGSTDAYAVHLSINGGGDVTFDNYGTLNSTANTARGIYTTGDDTVVNHSTGIINANGTNSSYGMEIVYALGTHVSNFGIINTNHSATSAYEVFGYNSNYTVGTWQFELRNWSGTDTVFGIDNVVSPGAPGKNIDFTNSHFIVLPSTEYVEGQPYYVDDMIAVNGSDPADINQTEIIWSDTNPVTVSAGLPFFTVQTYDWDQARPYLTMEKSDSPAAFLPSPFAARLEQGDNIDNAIRGNLYTSALNGNESVWTTFIEGYGSYTDNSEYNFDISSGGVVAAITYNFPRLSLGVHADYNYSSLSGAYNLDTDTHSFAFGAHGHYVFDRLYVQGQVTASFANSDMTYKPSTSISGSADYDSSAILARVDMGYLVPLNMNHILVPEIGISYLRASTDAYNTGFNAPYSAYNLYYDQTDYNAFYAHLMLTWEGKFETGFGVLNPSVGLGVRQTLSGSDMDVDYTIMGARDRIVVSQDSTVFIANASLEWNVNNMFAIGAYGDATIGSNQQEYGGQVRATFRF